MFVCPWGNEPSLLAVLFTVFNKCMCTGFREGVISISLSVSAELWYIGLQSSSSVAVVAYVLLAVTACNCVYQEDHLCRLSYG